MKTNDKGEIIFKNKTELKRYMKDKEQDIITQYTASIKRRASAYLLEEASILNQLIIYETLHLEFNFGKKRLKQFKNRYENIIKCYDDYKELYQDWLKEYENIIDSNNYIK